MTSPPLIPPRPALGGGVDAVERSDRRQAFAASFRDADWAAVRDVHARSVDAAGGFAEMARRSEQPFRELAERFQELHTGHAHYLAFLLHEAGEVPDANQSFMATVNHTVMSLRSAFDEIDADLMDSISAGEEHVMDAFQDALDGGLPDDVRDDLARMLNQLETLMTEVSTLP
jgi:hypothetical protein